MPQSLHVLSAHIIFSTKHRRPDLGSELRPGLWAYPAGILKNLECCSILGILNKYKVRYDERYLWIEPLLVLPLQGKEILGTKPGALPPATMFQHFQAEGILTVAS